MALKARVEDGRLILNEPTDLPEGTVIELEEVDPFADLSSDERERLNASIERGRAEARAGLGRPAKEVLAELRAKRQ
ncbi:MAG: hypothetical protein AAFU77_18060 [Myxococcota bacterium]